MQPPAQAAPLKNSGSFATLLTSIAGKLQNDSWDNSALEEDVAILTYDQALRAARRTRLPEPATAGLPDGDADSSSARVNPTRKPQQSSAEKKQRGASITIRVTTEEQAQLQERAKAAQLSVSAYLRSCIFEAESLRTQVKEALARMQSASADASSSTEKPVRNWRKRFSLPWSRGDAAESR